MTSPRGLILPQLMDSKNLSPRKIVVKDSLLCINKETGEKIVGGFEAIAEEIGVDYRGILYALNKGNLVKDKYEFKRLKPARSRQKPVSSKIYFITDGQTMLSGNRLFVEDTTGILLTKSHIGGLTLMGHCWAVGCNEQNAVERLKRLEHKRRLIRKGKIIFKAKLGCVTLEQSAEELALALGVKVKTICTAIGKTCNGYSIELAKPKRIIL